MAEPTVNDITGVTVDADRGTGIGPVVYDTTRLSSLLNNAANVKAENDWRKYTTFLGNLKDVYKDINEVAKTAIMSQDAPQLRSRMGEIIKSIGDDPRSFFGGGAKYNEILGKVSQLQQDATQSKQDNIFDSAHRAYFYRNPDLDTPENRKLIETFSTQKLGVRQPYQMMLPGMYDPDAMAKVINSAVKSETPYSRLTADQQNFETGVDTKYNPDQYKVLANQMYQQTDKQGVPISQTVQKRFNALPDDIKESFSGQKDPARAWFVDDLVKRMLKDSSTMELKTNPNYLEKESLAEQRRHNKAEEGIGWRNAEANYLNATKRADGTPVTFDVNGNALNGIPIMPGTKDGEYVVTDKGNQFLGQVQNVIGKDPLVKDNEPQTVSIRVKNGKVDAVKIHGKWMDRVEIENLQKARDKEAKGQEHQKYPTDQSFYTGTDSTAIKQGNKPSASASKYKGEMQDGSKIFSDDGKTWYDSNGNEIK